PWLSGPGSRRTGLHPGAWRRTRGRRPRTWGTRTRSLRLRGRCRTGGIPLPRPSSLVLVLLAGLVDGLAGAVGPGAAAGAADAGREGGGPEGAVGAVQARLAAAHGCP